MEATRPSKDKFLDTINQQYNGTLLSDNILDNIIDENAFFYIVFLCDIIIIEDYFEPETVAGRKINYKLRTGYSNGVANKLRNVPFKNRYDLLNSSKYKGYDKVYECFSRHSVQPYPDIIFHKLTQKYIRTLSVNNLETLNTRQASSGTRGYNVDIYNILHFDEHHEFIYARNFSEDKLRGSINNFLTTTGRGVIDPSTEDRGLGTTGLVDDATRPTNSNSKNNQPKVKSSYEAINDARGLAFIQIDNLFDKLGNRVQYFALSTIRVSQEVKSQSSTGLADKLLSISKIVGEMIGFEMVGIEVGVLAMGVSVIPIPGGKNPQVNMAKHISELVKEITGIFEDPKRSLISMDVVTNVQRSKVISDKIADIKASIKSKIITQKNDYSENNLNDIARVFKKLASDSEKYRDAYNWTFIQWFEFIIHTEFYKTILPVRIKMRAVSSGYNISLQIDVSFEEYLIPDSPNKEYLSTIINLINSLNLSEPGQRFNFWSTWHITLFPRKPIPIELSTKFMVVYEFDGRAAHLDYFGKYQYSFSSSFAYHLTNLTKIQIDQTGDLIQFAGFIDATKADTDTNNREIWKRLSLEQRQDDVPILPFYDSSWWNGN